MAVTEGGTILPTDSAGKSQIGTYDGTDFWHLRSDAAHNLKVGLHDIAGTAIQQDGSTGHKLIGSSQYGQTSAAGDTAIQVTTLSVIGDTTTSAAGAAATLSYAAAGANVSHYLSAIHVGYSAAPAAGSTVTITEDPAGTPLIKFVAPIVASGIISIPFSVRRKFTQNKAINIVLSAGGGSILAYINADHWTAAG